jgi:hypothetical protein
MLLGAVTLPGVARERYRILIRKNSDGVEFYQPMRKQYNGTMIRQWVGTSNVYATMKDAENVIKEWIDYEKSVKTYNNKRYIYIN